MLGFLADLIDASDVPEPDFEVDADTSDYACEDLSGVENGVFVGNEDDVEEVIAAGEVEDAEHIASEDIVRNIAMRDEFLSNFGYEGVPEGFEVHHIIPLSEGGADTPENMVLLPKEVHDQITAAHAASYGWHKG